MKHTVYTRWFTDPNWGCSYFPHNPQSSYEYLIHYHYCLQGSCGHPIGVDVIGLEICNWKSQRKWSKSHCLVSMWLLAQLGNLTLSSSVGEHAVRSTLSLHAWKKWWNYITYITQSECEKCVLYAHSSCGGERLLSSFEELLWAPKWFMW